MKKVLRLVSVQLLAVISDMLSIGKNRKKKPKFLYGGILFFIVLLGSVSFFYSMMIGSGLSMYSSVEILPSIMMAVTCIIIFFTTTFKIKGIIFGFHDYDMVMSLPVSTRSIVVSRLIILYALNFLFVIIMILPMMAAYGILVHPSGMFYLIGIVLMFFIPLVPIIIASILGTVIAYAASRFKYSNILNIIFTLAILIGIMSLSFGMNNNGKEIVDVSKAMTAQINQLYPLAGLYSASVIHYDLTAFVIFIIISAAAFLIYTLVVDKVFKKMNTIIMTGSYHSNYKMGSLKTSTPFKALYIKELKRFFASSLYVINTGFGIVMLTLAAIAVFFVDLDKVLGSPEVVDMVVKMSPVFIAFCTIMTCTTMVSISLEGKSFWIMKSLPVDPKTVYYAKIAVNLTVIAPAAIDVILLGIAFKMDLLQILIILLILAACAVFISFYGLFMNLLMPNFSWTSETVVIKNSAATLVTVFSAIAYVVVPLILTAIIPSSMIAYLIYFVLTILLDVLLYVVLMTYGKKRYYLL